MGDSEKPEMFGRSCRPREAKVRTYELDEDITLISNYTTQHRQNYFYCGNSIFVNFFRTPQIYGGSVPRSFFRIVTI